MLDADKLIDRLNKELENYQLSQNREKYSEEYLLGIQAGIRKALEIISEMESEDFRKKLDLIVKGMKKGSDLDDSMSM